MERITNLAMNRTVLDSNQRTLARIANYQQQLSSQKKFSKVSEDPVGARVAMRLRTDLARTAEWRENIDRSLATMASSDSTMGEMSQVLTQVKQAAVTGASANQDASSRRALAQGVDALLARMVDLGNTVHDGRYLFAGTATVGDAPFAANADGSAIDYRGTLDRAEVRIGPSTVLPINDDGHRLLKEPADVFAALIGLREALEANDPGAVRDAMSSVDAAQTQVDENRAELGGRVARLELARSQLESSDLQLQGLLSEAEDVDMTEVITQLNQSQVALEAGLQAGSRALQPTLLDFLR